MTNNDVITLLLEWSQRVEQSAEGRRRLAEEREEAEEMAIQIEIDNITRRNEEQGRWNCESVSKASNC